ncbi:MAG: GYF domain-containing protein [Paraprevotella sp.]|nr:GYF domain-containing protein [Paraprevotella sp.]
MEEKNYCTGNHILVGLGGTGGKILRAFKMRMFEEFPTPEERKKLPVSVLYVDSTDEMMPKGGHPRPDFRVMGQDASFTNNEFFYIKDVNVEHILDHIGNYPSIKGIVGNVSAVKSAIGSIGQAAGQKRRAGRLLFAANAVGFVNSLKNVYARCESVSGNCNELYVYIFAGLSGGTGSGSIIDVVLQTRKAFPDAIISVYAMMPEMHLPAGIDQGNYYPNGYAALNELNALQAGRFFPQDVTGNGEARFFSDARHGVADGLTIYSNVNENGMAVNSFSELPKIVSDFIFARIFEVNCGDDKYGDIKRAFTYENMNDHAMEYDEAATMGNDGKKIAVRTKKVNSFGIKRVMYPELRIHKHITYTVGESVLYQFKYNNWRENQGFVNEERNKDYRKDYLNADNLAHWMLDDRHLTQELKVLPSDADYPLFSDYWHDKAVGYAEEAKHADCPLNELDNIMAEFYTSHFREEGVEGFFTGKLKVIPEMAKEIRHNIESELFEKWKIGDVSIVELQKVSKLLLEHLTDMRQDVEAKSRAVKEDLEAYDQDRKSNVSEWGHLGILQKMVGKGAQKYAEHQNILTDYYTAKTMVVAWEFAKQLFGKVFVEIGKMHADILSFNQKINDAIEETEKLVAAQRKVNKGLEDYKSAIIEVSEDEAMAEFENDLKTDKTDMPNIARQLRDMILPQGEFVSFGALANEVAVDDIKDAFDLKLTEIVKAKHDEKADNEHKVLGLNILTQLQQKLKTDADISAFAYNIMAQSGAFLKLNNDQIQLQLRNNETTTLADSLAAKNKKTIFISIPAPEKDAGALVKFRDKLVAAFDASVKNGGSTLTLVIDKDRARKDELCVISVSYCFPLRAIDWMATYKTRYEDAQNTGNSNTDVRNAILLHSEGNGQSLPSLFALSDEEIEQKLAVEAAASSVATLSQSVVPPVMHSATSCVPVPPSLTPVDPKIQLFMAVNGQNYGPYDYATCKQLVANGQLTPQSMVWMEGMPAWSMAGQVVELQPLFAPAPAPGMPPLPPTGGATPPPMM